MRKLLLYFILFFISPNEIKAQLRPKPQNLVRYDNKKMHFGFTLGLNSLDFNIKHNNEVMYQDSLYVLQSNSQKGFNLGIVSNFRMGKYTDFRFVPAIVFGERRLLYSFADTNNVISTEIKAIEFTLLDFPFYVKYKSERYNNFRSYVLFGIKGVIVVGARVWITKNLNNPFCVQNFRKHHFFKNCNDFKRFSHKKYIWDFFEVLYSHKNALNYVFFA